MTYQEEYESLIEQFIERDNLTIETIQKEARVNVRTAKAVLEEWKKYHDEEFWINSVSEINKMDEVATPIRIMILFDISYYFAQKVFEYYMENC